MKKSKIKTKFVLIGASTLIVLVLIFGRTYRKQISSLDGTSQHATADVEEEVISDTEIPLAAPKTAQVRGSAAGVSGASLTDMVPDTTIPISSQTTVTQQPQQLEAKPASADSTEATSGQNVEVPPATEEPTSGGNNGEKSAGQDESSGEEPEGAGDESETPVVSKATKPDDITDVTAMAKYLYDAATEFWAVEKDFCGTTTRPVSTRVASSIGSGTAVDCPGGDTTRVDKNGVEHDSYAIADHFREYVDMPDLQNFKIYLSDKDYTVDPYGAREEVVGAYYQYGGDRDTYTPEPEAEEAPAAEPEGEAEPAAEAPETGESDSGEEGTTPDESGDPAPEPEAPSEEDEAG